MKMIPISFALLFLAGICGALQAEDSFPKIVVDSLEHDFGEIGDKQTLTHVFALQNDGQADLVIEKVEADKNCLIVEKTDGLVIEPGQAYKLMVRFNPQRLLAAQERSIRIHSNDPENPLLTLKLRADIRVDWRLSRPFLYFKEIYFDARPCDSLVVESFMDEPLDVHSLIPSHDFFSAVFRAEDDEGKYFIDIEVDGSRFPPGERRVAGKLEFETNSKNQPRGSLTILFAASDELLARPESLLERDMSLDKEYSAKIDLIHREGKAVEVTGVRFSNDQLVIKEWSSQGGGVLIRYELSDAIEYASAEGRFELDVDMEKPSKLAVPFKGILAQEVVADHELRTRTLEAITEQQSIFKKKEIKTPPREVDLASAPLLEVDREMHDFGVLNQGDDAETTFTISNTGKGDLVIEKIKSGCGCATVTDLKGKVIPPGGSEDLTVRLSTSNKALNLSKSVKIYSNDPMKELKRVVLKAYIHVDYRVENSIPRFHDFRQGSVVTQRVDVQSYMDKPLEILEIKADRPFIRCTAGKNEEKEDKYFIDVTVDSSEQDLGTGTVHGRVTFKTNSEQLPKESFTLFVEMIKDIKYTPRKVSIYRFAKSTKDEVLLKLENVLQKGFSIRSIETGLESVDAEVIEQGECDATIAFKLNDKAKKGRARSTTVIHLDYEGQEKLEIPLSVLIM
ncbi:MAG: DUF1573 domain-containing protein [Planctomycetota bacterium]